MEIAVKCRSPASEACMWAKAYLPLTRPLYFVVFCLLTYGILSLIVFRMAEGHKASGELGK